MPSIFIVDDEKKFINHIEEILLDYDVSITKTHCGDQAIELINDKDFDLIITDLSMSDGDGLHLIEHIARTKKSGHVILMSSYATPDSKEALTEYKLLDIVSKPLESDKLIEHFNTLFKKI